MRVINDPRSREELETAIAEFRSELEAHQLTVGVPAPLPPDVVVDQLARTADVWVLSSELPPDEEEEPELTLAELKDRRLKVMQRARDVAMAAGFEFEGNTYHSDKDAIRDVLMALTGAQLAAEPVPERISWKLKERAGTTTHRALSLQELGALFRGLTTNMMTIYGREEARMADILAARDAEEVLGVMW
jgi:hypothetical protein